MVYLNNAVSRSELKNDIYCLKTAKSSPSSKFVHSQHSWLLSMFERLQKKKKKKKEEGGNKKQKWKRGGGGGGPGSSCDYLRIDTLAMKVSREEAWTVSWGRALQSVLHCLGKKGDLPVSELKHHMDCLNTAISLSELGKNHLACLNTGISQSWENTGTV